MGNRWSRKKKRRHGTSTSSTRYDQTEGMVLQRFVVDGTPPRVEFDNAENEYKQDLDNKFFLVRALYPFEKMRLNDLSFNKGDTFFVKTKELEGWLHAYNLRTKESGFIPGNYVCMNNGLPNSLDCYYEIDRLEAEKKLFSPGLEKGTYIIRPKSDGSAYVLSVLVEPRKVSHPVKHFVIHTSHKRDCFFLSADLKFTNISDLIKHYSSKNDHLQCLLTVPCPRNYQPSVQFRDLEVDRETITRGRSIGRGEFGEVYEGVWNGQLKVALKYHLLTMDRGEFLREAEIMHQLHHERLVQLMGVCTEPREQPLILITEYMSKGSLLEFLKSDEGKSLTIKDYILMMTQISDGMKYLEAKLFIHRDLRAANILVDRNNSVKVADFGLARLLQSTSEYKCTTRFPIKWTAPEAAVSPYVFSIRSDVWSFGVVMYEIVEPNHEIYANIHPSEVSRKINEGYRMPNPVPGDPDIEKVYECMLCCWNADPKARPTFRELHRMFCSWEFVSPRFK